MIIVRLDVPLCVPSVSSSWGLRTYEFAVYCSALSEELDDLITLIVSILLKSGIDTFPGRSNAFSSVFSTE